MSLMVQLVSTLVTNVYWVKPFSVSVYIWAGSHVKFVDTGADMISTLGTFVEAKAKILNVVLTKGTIQVSAKCRKM